VEGRRQAERVGRRLAGRRFSGFYSSDLERAMETARVIGESVGLDAISAPGLREINLGEWEGLRTEDLARRYPEAWAGWSREPDWDLVPGGEGAARFEARAGKALDALFDLHPGGEILVVTHGGVIQVALHRVIGRASRGLFQFKIQNASISVIERHPRRDVIGGVNDVSHLETVPSDGPVRD
jgi:broad specificity phosphatase PhoE